MAMVSINVCDHCKEADSEKNRVMRVLVMGVHFDLCEQARRDVLTDFGLSEGVKDFLIKAQNEGTTSRRGYDWEALEHKVGTGLPPGAEETEEADSGDQAPQEGDDAAASEG